MLSKAKSLAIDGSIWLPRTMEAMRQSERDPSEGSRLKHSEVIFRVHQLILAREPLNISAVRRNHPLLLDSAFAKDPGQPFLGWRNAVRRAGGRYEDLEVELSEFVVCKICGEEKKMIANHALYKHQVTIDEYREQFPGADEISDVSRAIKCHGFPNQKILPHWEPFWTPEYILDRAFAFHEAGYPMHFGSIVELDVAMANAVRDWQSILGDWNVILEKIGLDPAEVRRRSESARSPDEVVTRIHARHDSGITLNSTAVQRGEHVDLALYAGAVAYFGSWEKAVAASGYDPMEFRILKNLYDSPEKVIAELQRREREGLPLNHGAVQKEDGALEGKIYYYFGTWDKGLRAAGIDPEAVKLPRLGPNGRSPHAHFQRRKDVLEAILRRVEQGLPLNSGALHKGPSCDATLVNAAKDFFGSWNAALEAAGLDSKKICQRPYRRFSRPEEVIEHLRKLYRSGAQMHASAIKEEPTLYRRAREHFGSYAAAAAAAGIPPEAILPPSRRAESAVSD